MVKTYGASVRGPRNQRHGHVNQDAWLHASGKFGYLIGVSDGMGSKPASHIGAHAVCRAVHRAAHLWPGVMSSADPKHFVRLVEILWRLALSPQPLTEYASTCLFALRESDGHLLLAGLGDGLAIVRHGDGSMTTFGERGVDSFGNETLALGIQHNISDWWIATAPPSPNRTVVLVTDGIADDLDPQRLDIFVDWLTNDIGCLSPVIRWRRICRELRAWPVPSHVDDKTVAVLVECSGETV